MAGSRRLAQKVLEARLRILGEDHHDGLSSMDNLATVLRKQGKWQEAEDIHRKVLEARWRTLGEDHPDTLGSLNNLAIVLQAQGKWQKAEYMHQKDPKSAGSNAAHTWIRTPLGPDGTLQVSGASRPAIPAVRGSERLDHTINLA